MNTIKKIVKSIFKNESLDEKYLASSASLADLERRQRALQMGQAPHQKYY